MSCEYSMSCSVCRCVTVLARELACVGTRSARERRALSLPACLYTERTEALLTTSACDRPSHISSDQSSHLSEAPSPPLPYFSPCHPPVPSRSTGLEPSASSQRRPVRSPLDSPSTPNKTCVSAILAHREVGPNPAHEYRSDSLLSKAKKSKPMRSLPNPYLMSPPTLPTRS